MSNITSVSLAREESSNGCISLWLILGGIFTALFSIFAIINGPGGTGWQWLPGGILAAFFGFLLQRSARPTFIVRIGSASGEMKALSSQDKAHMKRIVDAVNEAIVRRG